MAFDLVVALWQNNNFESRACERIVWCLLFTVVEVRGYNFNGVSALICENARVQVQAARQERIISDAVQGQVRGVTCGLDFKFDHAGVHWPNFSILMREERGQVLESVAEKGSSHIEGGSDLLKC